MIPSSLILPCGCFTVCMSSKCLTDEHICFHSFELGGFYNFTSDVWTGDGKILALQKMLGDDCVFLSGQAGWPEDQLDVLDRKRYIGSEDGNESGGRTQNKERLERFLKVFSAFPPHVLEFIKKYYESSANILEHPVYFRPVGRPWGKGRVTLVGDAAHIITPNMAMGTPLAFEDSVSLAHAIYNFGLSSEALRKYEEERQPRVNKIGDYAIRSSGAYYKDKDDSSNPFRIDNNNGMTDFIRNFAQEPVPAAGKMREEL